VVLAEIRTSFKGSGDGYTFRFDGSEYRVACVEVRKTSDRWSGDKSTTTNGTIILTMDEQIVFEFQFRKTVTYPPDAPLPLPIPTEMSTTSEINFLSA
jgi:hypothetical protein